eukprot:TRINITY_DN40771_c0_g1_i1.p1 TRINITY_DN40771_c0_g1~~TRINITY_DN40771_c0_g1_i1.p1  ORF type:complete len:772 (+),score=123.47 TRINITY_DN40771_c0_g1_i1:105-2420(+)
MSTSTDVAVVIAVVAVALLVLLMVASTFILSRRTHTRLEDLCQRIDVVGKEVKVQPANEKMATVEDILISQEDRMREMAEDLGLLSTSTKSLGKTIQKTNTKIDSVSATVREEIKKLLAVAASDGSEKKIMTKGLGGRRDLPWSQNQDWVRPANDDLEKESTEEVPSSEIAEFEYSDPAIQTSGGTNSGKHFPSMPKLNLDSHTTQAKATCRVDYVPPPRPMVIEDTETGKNYQRKNGNKVADEGKEEENVPPLRSGAEAEAGATKQARWIGHITEQGQSEATYASERSLSDEEGAVITTISGKRLSVGSVQSMASVNSQETSFQKAMTSAFSMKKMPTLNLAAVSNAFRRNNKRSATAEAIWTFLEDPDSSPAAYYYAKVLDPITFFTVFICLLQTTPSKDIISEEIVGSMLMSTDVFFLSEILTRFAVNPNFNAFIRDLYNINDFMAAIFPLSVRLTSLIWGLDLESDTWHFILYCVMPILRLLKVLRRFQQFHLFLNVVSNIREAIEVLMILLAIMVLIFAVVLYALEPRDLFDSVPTAIWFTLATMSTVGYGDITPATTGGHLVACILVLCSVLYMAMPIGIIGNAFTQIWQDRDRILLMIKTRDRLLKSGYMAQDLPIIFKQYNTTGDGQLTAEQFFIMAEDMQCGLNEERATEVFNSIDKDGGGSIDEQEFVKAIFPSAYHQLYGRDTIRPSRGEEDDEDEERVSKQPKRSSILDTLFARQSSGASNRSGGGLSREISGASSLSETFAFSLAGNREERDKRSDKL